MHFIKYAILASSIGLFSCSSSESKDEVFAERPDSLCNSACDSSPLSYPVVTATGGYGAMTTYGNVSDPEFSGGGACNYGATKILNYAAVHVDVSPGDADGLWDGGRHCGDCLRVRVGSETGWRTTIVRVVDACPDEYCGVDLGGNPAKALMGAKPGRYSGEWEWVDCNGAEGVFDGDATLYVKDGSNQWWSIVQVRNGPAAVTSMHWIHMDGSTGGKFKWATEAENFYKVPAEVLSSSEQVKIIFEYRNGESDTLAVIGTELGIEKASFPIRVQP